MTATVAEILASKSGPVHTLAPTATVREALLLMAEANVGSVLVMEDQTLRGIFTERDYARKLVLQGRGSADTPLSAVMTGRLYVIAPEKTVDECMNLMTKARIRHLPVMQEGKLVGLVSIGDLVNATIAHQQFLIEQMENYIAGNLG